METIKAILYGVGAIGSLIARALLEKKGLEIVGAVDIAEDKVGKDLGEVLGLGEKLGAKVYKNAEELFLDVKADIAVHATSSFLKQVYPQIASLIKHGVDVISTCEELAYPYYSNPKIAGEIDKLAKKTRRDCFGNWNKSGLPNGHSGNNVDCRVPENRENRSRQGHERGYKTVAVSKKNRCWINR